MLEAMAVQKGTKDSEIDRVLLQKLGDANEILRAAHPQRVCYDMLRTKNPSSDGTLDLVDLDIDIPSLSERLYVKLAGYR
jgi:hypothetical protein